MNKKSLRERVLHASIYEITALGITIPGAALLLDHPIGHIGTTVLGVALLAMVWNMLFNAFFDRVFPPRLPRRFFVRLLQAIGFEGGLLLLALPFTAWTMHIPLTQAFAMDIGLLFFYLPYTYVFNWAWDTVVTRYLKSKTIHYR
ncbi:PACE efflux transporter [Rosenbergiella australiborealis]|uniref:PACE efflux transporter n=1 Tax=Rosenbergiella australiborealis TaxID=1544696 RepID=A0ABS5T7X6_9GAMM|nr:PACE efflux transporter [Rosenbergiella australiborealis]MBT0728476.1 PACE efflux transporter [Rosenbergiella australiborealis]